MNVEVRAALFELCKNKLADDYVFESPKTDGHLTEVKKGFKTALRIAGVEGLRWRDLRATFGTRLGEAGYDAFTIAQLMGHSDVRMLLGTCEVPSATNVLPFRLYCWFPSRTAQRRHNTRTATKAGGCKWLKINGGAEGARTPGLRIANRTLGKNVSNCLF
jgi:Phage integrase family